MTFQMLYLSSQYYLFFGNAHWQKEIEYAKNSVYSFYMDVNFSRTT